MRKGKSIIPAFWLPTLGANGMVSGIIVGHLYDLMIKKYLTNLIIRTIKGTKEFSTDSYDPVQVSHC